MTHADSVEYLECKYHECDDKTCNCSQCLTLLFFWQLSNAGGRLIIASDGVWDALSSEKAAVCCRGLQQPEVAAKHIVKVEKYA
jgi:Zn-finger protein